MNINEIIKPKSKEEIEDLEKRGFRKDSGKWKFRIDISELVNNYDNKEDTSEFKESIIKILEEKVKDVPLISDDDDVKQFKSIIKEFKNLNSKPSAEDIDNILGSLYDWADDNDVWIESF